MTSEQPTSEPTSMSASTGAAPRLSRARALAAAGLCTAVALGVGTRPWATGTPADVLTTGARQVSGAAASPAMMGLLLIVVLAVVGLLLGGRALRVAASVLALLASVGATVLSVTVALNPAAAVAGAAATELGRTSVQVSEAATTPWAWAGVAVLCALTVTVGGIVAGTRRWAGLSSRYEREPATRATAPDPVSRGPRGQVRTDWDELSEGRDPTLRDP